MAITTAETPLREIISRDHTIIPVLNRLGIGLGTGDLTVMQAGLGHGLDPAFLLSVINTWLSDEYFPETALKEVDLNTILGYLALTDRYYLNFQIPNIERHFNALLATGPDNQSLTILRRFFDKVKTDLNAAIGNDLRVLFPALKAIAAGEQAETPDLTDRFSPVEEMTADLTSMMVRHTTGTFDPNLGYATFVAIHTLGNDLRKNNRIRNLILLPHARELTGTTS